MSAVDRDPREVRLREATHEYARRMALGEPAARERTLERFADLRPELDGRLEQVEKLLGDPRRPGGVFPGSAARGWYGSYEYRSKRTLFGLPLVHVANGIDPATGRPRVARGIVAIGSVAIGGFAMGGVAIGGLAFGGVSLGLVGIGGVAVAGFALGGLAIGMIALGGAAAGYVAVGGGALGVYAAGGGAAGVHCWSEKVRDPAAVQFFQGAIDGIKRAFGG